MVKSCFQKPFQNSWLGAATHTLQVQASLCNCIIRGEYYISPDPFIPHSFRAWPFSSSHTRATAARRTALETGAVTERGPSRANPIRVALTQHFQTGPRTHACGEKDKKKKLSSHPLSPKWPNAHRRRMRLGAVVAHGLVSPSPPVSHPPQ